jgi:hypothetical protein
MSEALMKRIFLALLLCSVPFLSRPLAAERGCPLHVAGRLGQNGLAVVVPVGNRSRDDAVRCHSIVLTWNDYLNQYHEREFLFDVLIQPRQTVRLQTPPLLGEDADNSVVNYSTVAASVTCGGE